MPARETGGGYARRKHRRPQLIRAILSQHSLEGTFWHGNQTWGSCNSHPSENAIHKLVLGYVMETLHQHV